MPEILIQVRNKNPVIVGDVRQIVADNSDYTIRFIFDELWEDGEKTVYFVRSNGFVFPPGKTVDDAVTVPVQTDVKMTSWLYVGVQQGDIKTSCPVNILLVSSIADCINDDAVQPETDMWQDIMRRLAQLEKAGLAYDIGFGLALSEDYVLSAEVGAASFVEIPNTKVQEIFNKVMTEV